MALSSARAYGRWGAAPPVSEAHVVSSTIFCLKVAWHAVQVASVSLKALKTAGMSCRRAASETLSAV